MVNDAVDPTFRFMTVDWDGQIRMDPSSSWAMQGLIGLKHHFDIAFACGTGHDRIHAGSLPGETHLRRFRQEAQTIVSDALLAAGQAP